jgi:hypothetical protein
LSSSKESSSAPCSSSFASNTIPSSSELSTKAYANSSCPSPGSASQDSETPAIAPLSVPSPQPNGNCLECGPVPTIMPTANESVGCVNNCSQAAAFTPPSSDYNTKSAECEGCSHKPENSTTTTSCVTLSSHNQTSPLRTVPYPTSSVESTSSNAANSMTHAGKSLLGLALVIYVFLFS